MLIVVTEERMHRKYLGSIVIPIFMLVWLFGFLSLIPDFSPHPLAAEKKTCLLAVIPQFPPLEIKRDWTPLIERISRETRIYLVLKFYKSFPDFEEGDQ